MKLIEEAMKYVPPKTANVADLDWFDVDSEVFDGEGTDKEGKTFRYKYIKVDEAEYRVPGVVLGSIRALNERIPNTKRITVIKSGEGLSTRYNVMPYTQPVEDVK